jgi:hypothetical protein
MSQEYRWSVVSNEPELFTKVSKLPLLENARLDRKGVSLATYVTRSSQSSRTARQLANIHRLSLKDLHMNAVGAVALCISSEPWIPKLTLRGIGPRGAEREYAH